MRDLAYALTLISIFGLTNMPRRKELDVYIYKRIYELKFTLKWGVRRIQKYQFPEIPLLTTLYTLTIERKRINSASLPRSG